MGDLRPGKVGAKVSKFSRSTAVLSASPFSFR